MWKGGWWQGRGIKPRSRNHAYTPCAKVVVVCVGLELRESLGHLQRPRLWSKVMAT